MEKERPYSQTLQRLRDAGLRPTRQRLALGRLLFDGGERHVTAEVLHEEAMRQGISVSLATVYNTLHQFTDAGLLRQVVVDASRTYFDTNTQAHHHFFKEDDGSLMDIPGEHVAISGLPSAPDGSEVDRIEVIVRLKPAH
ncbi:iron response transcriptional regulator IrrA [Tepidicaulis sp. LMO-SS28]|uniref:iron response transcriptional regulator IrrA n=1 Tax=Tepidicaulis sp. LMO-SS28 TaxID=3447455 RepID=UPI003EE17938